MGNNKQFDNILNECLEHLATGQETIEQCLQRYPEFAAELKPLLRTAMMMNKAVDVKPSDEFRARARYQMQQKMSQEKVPVRFTRSVPRWAIAVCTVMLIFVLGGGTVLAAANAMPGNPLYPVKLATENLGIKLAGSEERKAELYLAMTNERVNEMTWMVNNGKTQNLEAAVQRLNDYYAKINELSLVANAGTSFVWANAESNQMIAVPAPVTQTTQTAAQNTVEGIIPITIPPMTQTTTAGTGTADKGVVATPTVIVPQSVNASAASTTTRDTTTAQYGGSMASGTGNQVTAPVVAGNNTTYDVQLINILIYNAIRQPEQIQQLLNSDKVPESVKPELRQALKASVTVYQTTINNLNHQ